MPILIYGATGYTGRLCVAEARARGADAVLAARNRAALRAVGDSSGYEAVTLDLADRERLAETVSRVKAVLHAAGPFADTAAPMVEACLAAGVHYLDITGEIDVLEAIAARDAEARGRGVMLLPAAGFDVVPSDCLLAYTAAQAVEPSALAIAIGWWGGGSRGTVRTGVRLRNEGIVLRRGGVLVRRAKPVRRSFDFGGDEPAPCVSALWGDVATAFRSTGIGDITAYFPVGSVAGRLAAMPSILRRLMSGRLAESVLNRLVARLPEGPGDKELARETAVLVAVAEGGSRAASARLTVPHPYALTAKVAVDLALRAAHGEARPGYQTPSTAFGADYILGFDGVSRADIAAG